MLAYMTQFNQIEHDTMVVMQQLKASDRDYLVSIGNCVSERTQITRGAPQG